MPIAVVHFLVAAWDKYMRRAIAIAAFGLLYFASECSIHFSDFKHLDLRYQPGRWTAGLPAFSRLFVADFTSLIITGATLSSLCSFIFPLVAGVLSVNSSTSTVRNAPHAASNNVRIDSRLKLIILGLTLFLPVTFVLSIMPKVWFSTDGYYLGNATDPAQSMQLSLSRTSSNSAPRTPYSVIDLDQAVTAAAGTSVLVFSIFEIIRARRNHTTPPSRPVTAPSFGTAVGA